MADGGGGNDDITVKIQVQTDAALKALAELSASMEKTATLMSGQLGRMQESLGGLSTPLKHAHDEVGHGTSKWEKYGVAALYANQALHLVTHGYHLLKEAFELVEMPIEHFIEADSALQKLGATLVLVGDHDVKHAMHGWLEYTEELQKSTNADKEKLMAMVNMAKAIGLTDDQTRSLITTSVDLAAVSNQDVQSSFDSLLNTYKGVTRGVAIYAPEIKKLTQEQLLHGEAVEVLRKTYEGFGETQRSTITGQLAASKIALKELSEAVGGLLVALLGIGRDTGFVDMIYGIQHAVLSITPVFKNIGDAVRLAMDASYQYIKAFIDTVKKSFNLSDIFSLNGERFAATWKENLEAASKQIAGFKASLDKAPVDNVIAKFEGQARLPKQRFAGADDASLKEASSLLAELDKRAADYQAKLSKAGENQVLALQEQAAADQADFDILVKKLDVAGLLNKETLDKVAQTKELIAATADAGIEKAQKDALKGLTDQTDQMQTALAMYGKTTREQIEIERQAQLDKLDLLQKELELKGLLTVSAQNEIDIQRGIVNQQAKNKAKRAPNETGEKAQMGAQSMISHVMGGAMGAAMGMASAAGAVVSAMQAMVDFIPNLLDSITHLFTSITELPMRILKSVQELFKSFLKLLTDLPANIVDMISGLWDSVVDFLVKLPDAIVNGIQKLIPKLLQLLTEKLPDYIEKLIPALLDMIPKLLIGQIELIVKAAPKIMVALAKMSPLIIRAIILGLVEATKDIAHMVKNLLSGKNLFPKWDVKAIAEPIKDAAKDLLTNTSKLFSITDLKKAAGKADNLVSQVKEAGDKTWESFWAKVKGAWEWFKEKMAVIWSGFMNTLTTIWTAIKEAFKALGEFLAKVWEGILGFLSKVWSVISEVGKTLWEAIKGLFSFLGQIGRGVWDGLKNGVSEISQFFAELGLRIWDGLKYGLEKFSQVFANMGGRIWDGLNYAFDTLGQKFADMGGKIWSGLKAGLEAAGDFFKNIGQQILEGLGLGGSGGGASFSDKVKSIFKFAEGGYVPGQAMVAGNSPHNDTVVAMVSPGEAIIPRSALARPGVKTVIDAILGEQSPIPRFSEGGYILPNLRNNNNAASMNSMSSISPSINLSLNIYTDPQALDTNFIKTKLMPTIKSELKTASLSGQYVLSSKGVF